MERFLFFIGVTAKFAGSGKGQKIGGFVESMSFSDSAYLSANILHPLALGLSRVLSLNTDDKIGALANFLHDYKNHEVAKIGFSTTAKEETALQTKQEVKKEGLISHADIDKDAFVIDVQAIPASYSIPEFLNAFVNKTKENLGANVYIGQVNDSGEFLEYVAASQAFMETKVLKKIDGITFDVFNDQKQDAGGEEGKDLANNLPVQYPLLHVPNVLMSPFTSRLKFFKMRHFGAYICSASKFHSVNTLDNLKLLLNALNDPALVPEETDAKIAEIKATLLPARVSKIVLCADTIGQNRDFSKEELAFFQSASQLFAQELQYRTDAEFWSDFSLLRRLNNDAVSVLSSSTPILEEEIAQLKLDLDAAFVPEAEEFLVAKKKLLLILNLVFEFKKFGSFRGALPILENFLVLIGQTRQSLLHDVTNESDWKKIQPKISRDFVNLVTKLDPSTNSFISDAEIGIIGQKLSSIALEEVKTINVPLFEVANYVALSLKYRAALTQKRTEIALAKKAEEEAQALASAQAAAESAAANAEPVPEATQ